ncbi:hypothetical protein HPB52_023873 [Rhipicephalus sanguineus]|uniref:Uncharacterized protein n=1 Tax=Rhipicephalus sanguineus TaxID=34632 RepID=A0A9D4SVM9_RHISA|nr:hypothetical protein HPB52_023873 [Rhipicephalus sanguineus]
MESSSERCTTAREKEQRKDDMEKLKAQSTIIIKEATTALEGADALQLSALLQRLEVNNSELRQVNNDLESCLPDDIFEEDYANLCSTTTEQKAGSDAGRWHIPRWRAIKPNKDSKKIKNDASHFESQVRPFFTLTRSG